MEIKNIYSKPKETSDEQEIFETLHKNENLQIERIITQKPFELPGEWYDQEKDEWVLLLEGEAELEFKDEFPIKLFKGDHIFIPAHKIHRVKQSAIDQKCIWLAIHGNLK